MNKNEISIIVPVYNVENYLTECLNSILSQTYKNFELILVDDGSKDNSGVICDDFASKDPRIRVIHQKNSGVSAARNKGIDEAIGKWITFIDSDDWIEPNFLDNFGLDDANNVDLIMQGLVCYDQRDGHLFKPWYLNAGTYTRDQFPKLSVQFDFMGCGFPVCKAIRRSLLLKHNLRFDERIPLHEDHIFTLDLYQQCQAIRLVDARDYKYRYYHTSNSLSTKTHPWNSLNIASNELIARFEAMNGLFFENEGKVYRGMLTFAYSCKIKASADVILGNMPYSLKRKTFKNIIQRDQLRHCYNPKDWRNRLTAYVYMHFPFFIAYTYHHIIKYISRIKYAIS